MKFVERRADGSNGRLIRGDRHMVSAGHSAAATAALLVLEAGGNAVDAGVAAGLVLGVTQCDIVNVAGVAPIMIRDGASGRVVTIDGLGVWPAAASSRHFREAHGGACHAAPAHRLLDLAAGGVRCCVSAHASPYPGIVGPAPP
jgi:gamma-glutamyltranspeptidase